MIGKCRQAQSSLLLAMGHPVFDLMTLQQTATQIFAGPYRRAVQSWRADSQWVKGELIRGPGKARLEELQRGVSPKIVHHSHPDTVMHAH